MQSVKSWPFAAHLWSVIFSTQCILCRHKPVNPPLPRPPLQYNSYFQPSLRLPVTPINPHLATHVKDAFNSMSGGMWLFKCLHREEMSITHTSGCDASMCTWNVTQALTAKNAAHSDFYFNAKISSFPVSTVPSFTFTPTGTCNTFHLCSPLIFDVFGKLIMKVMMFYSAQTTPMLWSVVTNWCVQFSIFFVKGTTWMHCWKISFYKRISRKMRFHRDPEKKNVHHSLEILMLPGFYTAYLNEWWTLQIRIIQNNIFA